MLSAVTISLVPETRGGPFVFWDDLAAGSAKAAAHGFDAVEVFPASSDALDAGQLKQLLAKHNLKLAAVGSGGGWARHKLRLTDPEAQTRLRAREFVASIVDLAGGFGAPAIVGSMQGRWESSVTRDQALGWLAEALEELAPRAEKYGAPLLFEPLNRYESNVLSNVVDALAFLKSLRTPNVKLLCDLFHMNIEESDIAGSLRLAGTKLGHVHFVDSNRLAVGLGHTDIAPIAAALKEIGYAGYISAEALPLPDSDAAAKQTMASFRRWFGNSAS
jgi:sugar phosphate isomerase/epimerase